jgi:glycosyltransferase involved in cell wall biosynthesis
MKVLHVYRTYHPDQPSGIAEAIRQTCLATRPHGVESTIFTLSPRPNAHTTTREEAFVIRQRSVCAPASCDIGTFAAFHSFRHAAREADVIHLHFPWPFADLLYLSVKPRTPAVMTWHSDIVRQGSLLRFYGPLMNAMLRRMKLVAATSPTYARTSPVLSRKDVRDRVRILPLGVTEDSFPANEDTRILSKLDLNGPFILFLGALRYYKGLDVLLEAELPGVTLVLAGGGPELARLQAKPARAQRILFTGSVTEPEKAALLRACLALVLPSDRRSEAYGMVLVEAALCGKPMVSCEIGTGTSFVNIHNETGFVVDSGNPAALGRALGRLADNPLLAAEMGAAARRRYDACFSGPVFGRACLEFYREAISCSDSAGTSTTFQEKVAGS